VLGALESGVDFERRIADIYQSCRTAEEIDEGFARLQQELEEQIAARMADTRNALLENFDEEVHRRLRLSLEGSRVHLDHLERCLWRLTRQELAGVADFSDETCEYTLRHSDPGWPAVPIGAYQLLTRARSANGHQPYRLGHPLAEAVIARATGRALTPARVVFDYSSHAGKIGLLDPLVGHSGWLSLSRLTVSALEEEDRLLFAVVDENGRPLNAEVGARLFMVDGEICGPADIPAEALKALADQAQALRPEALEQIGQRNSRFFEEEIEKLDRWADDLKHGLEAELKELDVQIKQAKQTTRLAPDLEGKLLAQRMVRALEASRNKKRRELYAAQDEIDARRDDLIAAVEARLKQAVTVADLFTVQWSVG
jgi:adenine-specific DNA-methyltransferase